ncbi:transposase, partial [Hydrococcus rivularis]|uniref:transposase n=1 Tax=Hydrococcus rivularis TaxID=1616834 RepID=UPI003CCBF008
MDVGCIDVATVFDGESTTKVANPCHFNRIKRNLRRKQQQLAKKEKGSNKRAKAKRKVASVYEYLVSNTMVFKYVLVEAGTTVTALGDSVRRATRS